METTDPDVTLAIWPRAAFLFPPSNYRLIYEAPEAQRRRELSERLRAEAGGMLPDGAVELMLFVDTYNFRNSGPYSGEGVCLRMQPSWAELQQFRDDLKVEFKAFARRHGIVEHLWATSGDELPAGVGFWPSAGRHALIISNGTDTARFAAPARHLTPSRGTPADARR